MSNCCSESEWSYDKQEEWKCCYPLTSSLQTSPISIVTKFATYPAFTEFSLQYENGIQPSKFMNTGHDLRFLFSNTSNNILKLADSNKNLGILNNIHFHCPNEHYITDSLGSPVMEIHMVHNLQIPDYFPKQRYTNDPSKLRSNVAIGILLELGITTSPEIIEMFTIISDTKPPSSVELNIKPLEKWISKHSQYYVYTGSLTIPPLPTIVQWFVMKNRLKISSNDLKNFQKYYNNNARYRDQGGPRCYTGCPRHPFSVTKNFK